MTEAIRLTQRGGLLYQESCFVDQQGEEERYAEYDPVRPHEERTPRRETSTGPAAGVGQVSGGGPGEVP